MARKYGEPDPNKFKSRYGSFDPSPVERVSEFGGKVEEHICNHVPGICGCYELPSSVSFFYEDISENESIK
jgi:hypothetical protein